MSRGIKAQKCGKGGEKAEEVKVEKKGGDGIKGESVCTGRTPTRYGKNSREGDFEQQDMEIKTKGGGEMVEKDSVVPPGDG